MLSASLAAVIFGLVTIGLSFAAEYFGENVFTIAIAAFGILYSPIAGGFTLGLFVPWSTAMVRSGINHYGEECILGRL